MTDINKYRSVALSNDTFAKLERISKKVAPVKLSIAKTIEVLVKKYKLKEIHLSLMKQPEFAFFGIHPLVVNFFFF